MAGTIVTSATSDPPSHRPTTSCHVDTGDRHEKWNVPARTSAPSTASPMMSVAIGIISPKIPSDATLAKPDASLRKTARASRPNSTVPAQAAITAAQRRGGMHDRSVYKKIASSGGRVRDDGRPSGARAGASTGALIARAPGTGSPMSRPGPAPRAAGRHGHGPPAAARRRAAERAASERPDRHAARRQ